MNVILAGFNVDTDILNRLNCSAHEILTPETISAAYARVSRSQKNVTQLRKQACLDVRAARNSNKTIIFDMGHHSVAEHAVFNFDLTGISRLALEEIEKFRLISCTEKSQRYVTLQGDFVVPAEIQENNLQDLFLDVIGLQNKFYLSAFLALKKHIFHKNHSLAKNVSNHKMLEGWAKEDARYILSLATQGQVGLTINARNLEHMIRRFSLSRWQEVRGLGQKLFSLVEPVAPSIILFKEASEFEKTMSSRIQESLIKPDFINLTKKNSAPAIIDFTKNGDEKILAAFVARQWSIPFSTALKAAKKMGIMDRRKFFKNLFSQMEFFDAPPREFELADFTFQARVSAACYAQLKRHRLATLLAGDYDSNLGNTIPGSMKAVGLEKEFLQIIDRTHEAYHTIRRFTPAGADYILTNSHRRPITMKMNLREFYHFVRLRDDEHAQWDIRSLSAGLLNAVKQIMPLSALLLCGKSQFAREYENLYYKKPKLLI